MFDHIPSKQFVSLDLVARKMQQELAEKWVD